MDDIHAVLLQHLIFLAERGRVKVLLRVDDGSRSREGMESITFSSYVAMAMKTTGPLADSTLA